MATTESAPKPSITTVPALVTTVITTTVVLTADSSPSQAITEATAAVTTSARAGSNLIRIPIRPGEKQSDRPSAPLAIVRPGDFVQWVSDDADGATYYCMFLESPFGDGPHHMIQCPRSGDTTSRAMAIAPLAGDPRENRCYRYGIFEFPLGGRIEEHDPIIIVSGTGGQ